MLELKRAIQSERMSLHACGNGRKNWRVGCCAACVLRACLHAVHHLHMTIHNIPYTLLLIYY